ncbi:hydantoinase B/oxoprolinase family protein [Marinihelvus fidelis]|uniref:Hydantoinase B/oxoprolinase family protein n=1 Tax=Marinihelvus fidelis TaxID=2613842 RepID=A0A5N0TG16_9GAMM|nr:hydantoinase B/oxoprolinase family protein [Marinihelvus fidelis]
MGLFASRVAAICEEMGALLGRVALSPNIRDRKDYSCALFDRHGGLLGQATHIPVHLGSMAQAMTALAASRTWSDGDVLVLNDPFNGGTHLPDITLVAPVFADDELCGFSANRAHHADIGADAPGSMPVSTRLEEEGVLIPPSLLFRAGERQAATWRALPGGGARGAGGDFDAQLGACQLGVGRLRALVMEAGLAAFQARVDALNDYAERVARAALADIPAGEYTFSDVLDDDGAGTRAITIAVRIRAGEGGVEVDFDGTSAQVSGNLNCPLAVTAAAVVYVLRCLMPAQVPSCAGAFRAVRLVAPEGSVVNARAPAAVAAGNVETSTRIVDVVCGALAQALPGRIPAASQGSMNNLAMGRAGADGWDYYETLAGGHGAGPGWDGLSARHSHMTNTLNTPVEVLERHYPLRVRRYAQRQGSGGGGQWHGGDGLVREYEFLDDAQLSIISERRLHAPWGLAGGQPGQPGENRLDGEQLPGKTSRGVRRGQVLTVCTPGGGGYGPE